MKKFVALPIALLLSITSARAMEKVAETKKMEAEENPLARTIYLTQEHQKALAEKENLTKELNEKEKKQAKIIAALKNKISDKTSAAQEYEKFIREDQKSLLELDNQFARQQDDLEKEFAARKKQIETDKNKKEAMLKKQMQVNESAYNAAQQEIEKIKKQLNEQGSEKEFLVQLVALVIV